MTLFIYGAPGSGKSTVGRLLAKSYNCDFIDLDEEIEKKAGESISRIFEKYGEDTFRDLEREILRKIVPENHGVVSLGGGSLLKEENRALVENSGEVLCLSIGVEDLIVRLREQADTRPLLADNYETNLRNLMDRRNQHYHSFELQIDTSENCPEEIVWRIQSTLGRFFVKGMGSGYEVLIGNGLEKVGQTIREIGARGPVALVSDENVAMHYAAIVEKALTDAGYSVSRIVIPAGEAHKNMETVATLWEKFLEAKMERKSTVVALGGGVVGDLTGFAAATFLRGIPWINIPTSLLAMIDAGIGGKTGADLPQGKNLVGAFHAPRLVYIDPGTLKTLPPQHLKNGLGEVIKHGIIADEQLYALCDEGVDRVHSAIDEIVRRAAAVKIKIIQADPYESGLRQVLNLGHTIGHAVEKASNFRLLHGEAVAIGMVIESQIAESLGIAEKGVTERIRSTLMKNGLPVSIPPNLNRDEIIEALWVDKKRENGKIRFPLPEKIGKCRIGIEIEHIDQYLQGKY